MTLQTGREEIKLWRVGIKYYLDHCLFYLLPIIGDKGFLVFCNFAHPFFYLVYFSALIPSFFFFFFLSFSNSFIS